MNAIDDLPAVVVLDLVDHEIRRLRRMLFKFPQAGAAARWRAEVDHQLDLRWQAMHR